MQMNNMDKQQFEKEYRIHVYETSPDENVNICSLFNYMQDVAAIHAIKLGYGRDELMKNNNFWVLSRMYGEIAEYPFRNEKIIVKTWPYGTDNVFSLRFFELRLPDGRIIAKASSSWLIIDALSRRIQRPDEILISYNSLREASLIPVRIAGKIKEADPDGKLSDLFKVKLSDIDVNLHTNNVNYLKWTIDTYDFDFIMKYIPSSVEINYLAESMLGEYITIRSSGEKGGNTIFRHSILRDSGKELCRIRLEWKERKN